LLALVDLETKTWNYLRSIAIPSYVTCANVYTNTVVLDQASDVLTKAINAESS